MVAASAECYRHSETEPMLTQVDTLCHPGYTSGMAGRTTMNVSLTPELERLVTEKVASGRYQSASEVFREALRLLEEQDRLREMRLEEVRRQIAIGLEQARRGDLVDGEQVFERLQERARGRRKEAQ